MPEVETTVRGLRKGAVGWEMSDIWTDWPKYFKKHSEGAFKKCVSGRRIEGVERKGKNILIELSGGKMILIHQKMSGHVLLGEWKKRSEVKNIEEPWEGQKWIPVPFKGVLTDTKNRFIHLIFFLKKGSKRTMMALSDLRKFAKVICGEKEEIMGSLDSELGGDPVSKDFSFRDFKEALEEKKGRIKTVLMDQSVMTGVGNIYSDEILWMAGIHPLTPVGRIKEGELKKLYEALQKVLEKAVKLKGTSIDDYRTPEGRKGKYGEELLVYQRDGEPCPKCGTKIERIKIGNRSARFCPKCQVKR